MKKKLVSLLCVLLLVVGAVAGTYAYLIDKDTVVNEFTVGKVKIDLNEALVDIYGNPLDENDKIVEDVDDAKRIDDKNTYKLMPGHYYVKDPTVTVKALSEDSYVRMLVTFTCSDVLDTILPNAELIDIFEDYDPSVWEYVGNVEDNEKHTRTYEFRYKETVQTLTPNKDNTLEPLFTGFTFPETVTAEQLTRLESGFSMTVVAQAVQADTFEGDDDAAWAAFDAQYTPAP